MKRMMTARRVAGLEIKSNHYGKREMLSFVGGMTGKLFIRGSFDVKLSDSSSV